MKAVVVKRAVDVSPRQAYRYRVDYPGNDSNPRRKLVICRTKAAAEAVAEALRSDDVLWPVSN
jgi:hypothetical protein